MAETDPQADLEACLRRALEAVNPAALVRRHLDTFEPPPGKILLAAVGKASAAMAEAAEEVLGDRLNAGVVIAPPGIDCALPERFEVFEGGHPEPAPGGVEGARRLFRLAGELEEGDLLLGLISGGGSALMTLPPEGLTLDDLQVTTRALLRSGATIGELNAVRKHLDLLKGGRLARRAFPAQNLALVLSDVIGDPLEVIASGPLTADPTTFEEAVACCRLRGVWDDLPSAVRQHLERGVAGQVEESPKPGDACFAGVEARIVGNNRRAAEAALAEARERGYKTLLLTTTLAGEAREAGSFLAEIGREIRNSSQPIEPPALVIAAGETTVQVVGKGRGGRNQELALGAALALDGLDDGVLVAGFGTDGIDGPTDAAGAIARGNTLDRARALGLDASAYLADNNANPFFDALRDLLITGPTGTNVMDLYCVLVV